MNQTNSEWNNDGLSISGEYERKQLERIPIEPGFWFADLFFPRDITILSGVK
ncbi:MAG: hypothetical protein IIA20_03825 [Thaumarchaeota archaeon]|nr:hypothetical protein [Nitrososphaerota archaeon]